MFRTIIVIVSFHTRVHYHTCVSPITPPPLRIPQIYSITTILTLYLYRVIVTNPVGSTIVITTLVTNSPHYQLHLPLRLHINNTTLSIHYKRINTHSQKKCLPKAQKDLTTDKAKSKEYKAKQYNYAYKQQIHKSLNPTLTLNPTHPKSNS